MTKELNMLCFYPPSDALFSTSVHGLFGAAFTEVLQDMASQKGQYGSHGMLLMDMYITIMIIGIHK